MKELVPVFAITACLAACAVEEDPIVVVEGDPIPQGLTVFSEAPDAGLAAMYAEGVDVVFLETTRTIEPDPGPDHQSFLADGTAVNINVRFSDMEGRDLIVSLATEALPAGWESGTPQFRPEDIDRRARLGALIQKAGASLRDARIAAAMEAEVVRVETLAATVPPVAPPHEPPPRSALWGDDGPGWFYRYFEVRKKWIGWPLAEHSATQWWNCESHVGCYGYQETSNHGSSASSMGVNCSNVSPWIWQGYMSAGNVGSCDWYSGYSVCGMFGGNHNCHDDSKFQMKRVLGCGWYGSCSSAGCDGHAPGYCGC